MQLGFHPNRYEDAMKAEVMPDKCLSLPTELSKYPGLVQDGEVIALLTLDQVVTRAQALSRKLVAGRAGVSVNEFLSDRAAEWG